MKTEFINDLLDEFEDKIVDIDYVIDDYQDREESSPCEWRARLIELKKNEKSVYQDLINFVKEKYWK